MNPKSQQLIERGCFITVEGIEGAGKSTAVQLLGQLLSQRDLPHLITREPGGTPLAESIRALLLEKHEEVLDKHTELLLMFASRCQHVKTRIEPALQAGEWVVCDRFSDASRAYQGGGRGIATQIFQSLENITHPGLEPDLTLLFDIDPKVGLSRIASRQHDRIESEAIAFFEAARAAYLARAKEASHRFVIIDASKVLSKVKQQLRSVIVPFIEKRLNRP